MRMNSATTTKKYKKLTIIRSMKIENHQNHNKIMCN